MAYVRKELGFFLLLSKPSKETSPGLWGGAWVRDTATEHRACRASGVGMCAVAALALPSCCGIEGDGASTGEI